MEYKGYTPKIMYSEIDHCFCGNISFDKTLLVFEGDTLRELEKSFHASIDDYFDFIQEEKDTKTTSKNNNKNEVKTMNNTINSADETLRINSVKNVDLTALKMSYDKLFDALVAIEQQKQNALTVTLPCAIGTTMYIPMGADIFEEQVESFEIGKDMVPRACSFICGEGYALQGQANDEDITVAYLNYEEAKNSNRQ